MKNSPIKNHNSVNENYPGRRSIRLKGHGYTVTGYYFLTICKQNLECIFGETVDGEVELNQIGKITKICWEKIPDHFQNFDLDYYVIIPNHIHVIIIIENECRGMACHAPTKERQFGNPIPNSLSTIVGSFKSATAKHINKIQKTPGQMGFPGNVYS